MAADKGEVEILRADLTGLDGLTEKAMFGGLCFLLNGNMVCGVASDKTGGGHFRVGKENEAAARTLDGVSEMDFTGRRMGGFVTLSSEALADDLVRTKVLDMALTFARGLPPK